jgi:hypothetical protein
MLHGASLLLLISKEEEVTDLIKEKWVGTPTINLEHTKNSAKIYTKSTNRVK